jgi:hypothetical protein
MVAVDGRVHAVVVHVGLELRVRILVVDVVEVAVLLGCLSGVGGGMQIWRWTAKKLVIGRVSRRRPGGVPGMGVGLGL